MRRFLVGPRGWRTSVPVTLLATALGFALAVSVQAQRGPAGLAVARQDDLVRILADLDTRGQQLQLQIAALEAESIALRAMPMAVSLYLVFACLLALQPDVGQALLASLVWGALFLLAGTVAAHGPGVVLTIDDPGQVVTADVVVDAVEELRDAGAEAIELSGVRVVASTSVVDAPAGVSVDGHRIVAPYRLSAIGDAKTLADALEIPGGVTDTIASRGSGAHAVVTPRSDVRITSLRTLQTDRYARAAPTPSAGP